MVLPQSGAPVPGQPRTGVFDLSRGPRGRKRAWFFTRGFPDRLGPLGRSLWTLRGVPLVLRSLLSLILLIILGLSWVTEAAAGSLWEIQIHRSKTKAIEGLSLDSESYELEELEIDKQTVPLVRVRGIYSNRGLSLLYDNRPLVLSERSVDAFTMTVPLSGKRTVIEVSSVALDGATQKERIEILFNEYAAFQAVQAERRKPGLGLSPSLGITSLSYSETGVAPYSAVMLSGKLGLAFALAPPVWDGAANIFGNLAPIAGDSSGNVARFVGINFRVGYAVRSVRDPWKLGLMAGYYSNQMLVSGNKFGFRRVSGPQFFPTIRRRIGEGKGVYAYLKYAPVAPGGWISSLSDREIAAGVGGNWMAGKKTPLTLSLDFADLAVVLSGIAIDSRSLTLSLGTFL